MMISNNVESELRLVHVTLSQRYVFTDFALSITPKEKVVES